MKNEESHWAIHNFQFTIHNSQLISNSSAPHGMKTKIFKNLQKSYEKLYWNLYRIIIIVRFLKIFVRGKGGGLSCYLLIVNCELLPLAGRLVSKEE